MTPLPSLEPAQTRAARALLGWNQQELAAKANIAASTVADFERGKRVPVPNNLDAMRATLEANGISFLAGGAVIGPKPPATRSQLSRQGGPLRLIDVTDLEQWADRLDSKAVFPQLLTRLILATTGNEVLQLRFPSDESIQRDDWDGVCEQNVATDVPWLPTGVSGWELATQRQNISTKANGDYRKRTDKPRELVQSSSTFLFVSLRSWNPGSQWAQVKSAEGRWKAVKALDANDLVHWIELYPAVGYWLASYLDQLPEGLVPLENVWNEWRQATKWPLSTELVLAGRDGQAIETLKWLRATPSVRTVQADSSDEAIAFLYAAISMLPEPHRQFFTMRCLRVFSGADARKLGESPSPLVIVLEDPEPGLATRLLEKGHHVYVAHGSSIGISQVNTLLPRSPFEDFEIGLRNIGLPEDEAGRLSRDSFRSIVVLRRLIPSTTFTEPEWAQEPQNRLLLPCLLAGAWDSETPGDLEALKVLSSGRYEEVRRNLAGFIDAPDSPLRQAGTTWKIAAPKDAWFRLAKLITKDDLERFSAVARSVLGSADPRFEMDPDDRWLASVRGKLRENSPWLLSGLSETLLLIAMWGSAITAVPDASAYAGRIVSPLLKEADAQRWYSLSHQLMTLAEAAPKEFLSAVEDSLAKDKSPVMALFEEDGGPLFGSANHSHLLWALEVLAWDVKYLARVARILAMLDQRDPGGKWANRPGNSLRTVFLLWKPQTHATLAERLKVIDRLRRWEPDAAWRLMLGLLPSGHDSVSPNPRPRWRDSAESEEEVVTFALIGEGASALSTRLLEDAGQMADCWVQLIEAFPNLAEVARSKLLNRLTALATEFSDDKDRMPIWAALRTLLGNHRSFPDSHWALPPEILDQFEAVYDRFRPIDEVNQRAWLFSSRACLIGGQRGSDWEARDREILALQQEALSQLIAASGMSLLPKLIEKAERPWTVGFALAQNAAEITDLDSYLFSVLGDLTPAVQDFTGGLIGGLLRRFGQSWQASILTRARDEEWPDNKVSVLLLRLPSTPDIWAVAASFGDRVRTSYWRAIHLWGREDDDAIIYACKQLLAVARARTCVHLVAGARRRLPTQLVIEMLTQAAGEPLENASDQNEPVMFQWSVCQLLNCLDKDPEVQESEIAQLEWVYFRLLEYSERPPKVLHRRMSKQPAFFVEVLSAIFRPRSQSGSDQETVTKEQRKVASQAYRLMESWSTVPGLENGILNGVVLRRWVDDAHTLAVNAERGEIGDLYIGRILSYCPKGEDGIWPPVAMRDLLEGLRNQTVENGIVTGVYNKRGVTHRLPLDGGSLERAEASQYRRWANAVELEWPQTAALLERIANSFDESARHHDNMAERTQWAY